MYKITGGFFDFPRAKIHGEKLIYPGSDHVQYYQGFLQFSPGKISWGKADFP